MLNSTQHQMLSLKLLYLFVLRKIHGFKVPCLKKDHQSKGVQNEKVDCSQDLPIVKKADLHRQWLRSIIIFADV